MSRRRPVAWEAQQVIALQSASLLLGYPDASLYAQLPLLRTAAGSLPVEAALSLRRMVDHLESLEPDQAEQAYVDLFDLRRRCCLYLTYFAFGDTRKRGMALLKFTHAYKGAGRELIGDELPDHLCVVCEFAAAGDLAAGLALLAENRAGIELIRLALADAGSEYVHALDLIRVVLSDPVPQDLERAMDLARTGPPEEEVGLEPFAPPEYMGATRR